MRATDTARKIKAFSLLELLFVIALLVVFAALLLPAHIGSRRSTRILCMTNLKQVGLALNLFAADHNDQFSTQTPVADGGSMDYISSGSPARHFQAVSNYLGGRWHVLLCPTDKSRQQATNYAVISDRNISYFLSMDATHWSSNIILAGDRNWESAGQPVKPGLFVLSTNAAVGWTSELHSRDKSVAGGNLLFVDDHVEFAGRTLSAAIQRQNLATNRLAFP